MSSPNFPPVRISSALKWTIGAVAALGFLVDIYAILVAPLILQPALILGLPRCLFRRPPRRRVVPLDEHVDLDAAGPQLQRVAVQVDRQLELAGLALDLGLDHDGVELLGLVFIGQPLLRRHQRQPGQLDVWANPFTNLRLPKMFNLRMDPYEHADISGSLYNQWRTENVYLSAQAQMKAAKFLESFVEYPPSQRPAEFSITGIRKGVDKKIDESFKKRGME